MNAPAEFVDETSDYDSDCARYSLFWGRSNDLLQRLPPKPKRNDAEAEAAATILAAAREHRERFLTAHAATVYDKVTRSRTRFVRLDALVFEAAATVPGLVPTRDELAAESARPQRDKDGIEIDQGLFLAHVLGDETVMGDFTDIGSSALRCLWLTRMDPVLPDAGDLTYSFHLLTSLGRSGARLTVLAMCRTGDRARRADVNGIEWVILRWGSDRKVGGRAAVRSLFSHLPNVATQYNNASFRRALGMQMARDWDAIVLDHLGMGWAWPAVQAYRRRKPSVVSVFVAHGYESDFRRMMAQNFRGHIFRKLALRVDAVKAARLEREIVRSSTLFSTITSEDRDRFGNLPNSIVLTPGYAGVPSAVRTITSTTPRRALMFGAALWLAKQMNLMEFVDAADEVFSHHQIELWVVGRVPDQLQIRSTRATRFLGFVEDPQPVFRSVRFGIVAEGTGGGFKLKALDYIFNRVPVAALSGSIAGLPLTPGLHYLSFASMRELAQGVAAAIDDIGRLNSLQQAAYEKCQTAFDWHDRGRTLCNAIQQAVDGQRAAHARRAPP